MFVVGLSLSQAPGEVAVEATPTGNPTPGGVSSSAGPPPASDPRPPTANRDAGDDSGSAPAEGEAIQLEDVANTATPFQPVRIQGTYRGGPNTFLQVQRWEGGSWVAFPVPTKTDQWGQFTTYVELPQPGHHLLRVMDPNAGGKSKAFVLAIKG